MSEEQLERATKAIPAEIRMFSGCRDEQTSADVGNVASFRLPDPEGRSGGACTSAMLNVLYADEKKIEEDLTYQEVLIKMREILDGKGYSQIPQLSSSRPFEISETFDLVPTDCPGTKRAVLIGINYIGHEQGVLSGCHNDVHNMVKYIKDVHEFEDDNIKLLMDDDENEMPTKENIMEAFKQLVKDSKPGDAVFVHYSGHGARLKDDDGDEADGYDEVLCPVDYPENGFIRDDDVFKTLVGSMPGGVTMTSVMDCCHSGTIMDLPYKFKADGQSEEMTYDEDFDFDHLDALQNALLEVIGSLFQGFFNKL